MESRTATFVVRLSRETSEPWRAVIERVTTGECCRAASLADIGNQIARLVAEESAREGTTP